MRNVLHSGHDQTGAILLSTGERSEKVAAAKRLDATHHVWALSAVGAGALFWVRTLVKILVARCFL